MLIPVAADSLAPSAAWRAWRSSMRFARRMLSVGVSRGSKRTSRTFSFSSIVFSNSLWFLATAVGAMSKKVLTNQKMRTQTENVGVVPRALDGARQVGKVGDDEVKDARCRAPFLCTQVGHRAGHAHYFPC